MRLSFIQVALLAICGLSAGFSVRAAGVPNPDYNGDGRADLAVFHEAAGNWYIRSFSGGALAYPAAHGANGDTALPIDYNGDNTADLAIYRRASGNWSVRTLGGTPQFDGNWGWYEARAMTGDFNNDNQDDLVVYHRAAGKWYGRSATGPALFWDVPWGYADARPVVGDFDGDGRCDLAVYDERTGNWYIRTVAGTVLAWGLNWGFPGAFPVPGDYNGDGADDLAVYESRTGAWFIRTLSGTPVAIAEQWGYNGAVPVPGDYNNDGRFDLAVYDTNTGNWFIRSSTGAVLAWNQNWGWADAKPVARSLLSGHLNVDSKSAVGVNLQGEWVGQFYIHPEKQPSNRRSILNLFSTITQSGGSVTVRTTKTGVGARQSGTIRSDRHMRMVDAYDGEVWTTFWGPATYGSVRLYDFLLPPVAGGANDLQVIDLRRY